MKSFMIYIVFSFLAIAKQANGVDDRKYTGKELFPDGRDRHHSFFDLSDLSVDLSELEELQSAGSNTTSVNAIISVPVLTEDGNIYGEIANISNTETVFVQQYTPFEGFPAEFDPNFTDVYVPSVMDTIVIPPPVFVNPLKCNYESLLGEHFTPDLNNVISNITSAAPIDYFGGYTTECDGSECNNTECNCHYGTLTDYFANMDNETDRRYGQAYSIDSDSDTNTTISDETSLFHSDWESDTTFSDSDDSDYIPCLPSREDFTEW